MASRRRELGDSVKLLPHRKTLVGYARRIASAHSAVQIEILQGSYQGTYRDRFTPEEIEVLDMLCGYKLLQHETAAELNKLREQARGPYPPLRGDLQEFVARGQRYESGKMPNLLPSPAT